MDESILLRELGQVSSEDAGVVFRAYLRGCVRQMLTDVMAAEVTELCGAKYRPSESDHFRAGSSPGRILHEGQREEVVRPRVRKHLPDGSSEEVTLATYASANNPDELHASIVTALVAGVRHTFGSVDACEVAGRRSIECFSVVAGGWPSVRGCSPREGYCDSGLGGVAAGWNSFEQGRDGNRGGRDHG